MSMIVPAGNNKLDWSPKETKLQKVASDGQESSDIEVDALYEAAKGVVEASEGSKCDECGDDCCKDCGKGCKCEDCKCEGKDKQEKEACGAMTDDEAIVLDVEEVTEDAGGFGEIVEDIAGGGLGGGLGEVVEEVAEEGVAQSVSEAVAEVEEKAEAAEAVVQEVSEAVDQIEEAVAAVKEVCGAGDEGEEGEVELEIVEDEECDEGCEDEVPGEEEVDGEVIIEGKEDSDEDEAAMDKSASAEEFCKYAKLTPQNRKKLNDYWTNMLGYPKDFVNLMTKDYEK
jgi:hypothetical protein